MSLVTTIAVTVKPNSKLNSVALRDGAVGIRVKEPPREGKANEAARKALAQALGVSPRSLELIRGAASPVKVFAVTGLSRAELFARLSRLRG